MKEEQSMYNDELYHHGILGQKWGVRRFQDLSGKLTKLGKERMNRDERKTVNSMKRQVAADVRYMNVAGRMADAAKGEHKSMSEQYSRVLTEPVYSRGSSLLRLDRASKRLSEAGARLEETQSNYIRAKRIYKEDVDKYLSKVQEMDAKYGTSKLDKISEKQIQIGENYTATVIRTGITLANLPVIGRYQTAKLAGARDYEERTKIIDKKSGMHY